MAFVSYRNTSCRNWWVVGAKSMYQYRPHSCIIYKFWIYPKLANIVNFMSVVASPNGPANKMDAASCPLIENRFYWSNKISRRHWPEIERTAYRSRHSDRMVSDFFGLNDAINHLVVMRVREWRPNGGCLCVGVRVFAVRVCPRECTCAQEPVRVRVRAKMYL